MAEGLRTEESGMNIKLDRHEVCKVLLALSAVSQEEGTSKEFPAIHEKIKSQLVEWDKKRAEQNEGTVKR